jgi:hypothetical protein
MTSLVKVGIWIDTLLKDILAEKIKYYPRPTKMKVKEKRERIGNEEDVSLCLQRA